MPIGNEVIFEQVSWRWRLTRILSLSRISERKFILCSHDGVCSRVRETISLVVLLSVCHQDVETHFYNWHLHPQKLVLYTIKEWLPLMLFIIYHGTLFGMYHFFFWYLCGIYMLLQGSSKNIMVHIQKNKKVKNKIVPYSTIILF